MGDVGPDELNRRLDAHERRTDAIHASLDDRITHVASAAVPLAVWQQAERARDQQIAALKEEHREHAEQARNAHDRDLEKLREDVVRPVERRLEAVEQRPGMTIAKWAGVVVAVAAVLTLAVTAYGTLRGAH